jgi:hypothetical protein
MLVELAKHHFVVLVNHFGAKVTAVDVSILCADRERHQTKQHGCDKKAFDSHCLSVLEELNDVV